MSFLQQTLSSKEYHQLILLHFHLYFVKKFVPEDADKEGLKKESKKVIDNEIDLALRIISDKDAKIKNFILDAIRAGAITKSARNKYDIPGEGVSYTYDELVVYLTNAEKIMADIYMKISAQIKVAK